MTTFVIRLAAAFFLPMITGCGKTDFLDPKEGSYRRTYQRDADTYEIVELQNGGKFTQTFYQHRNSSFTNSGNWTYVRRNEGHSAKWPNGRPIIVFSEWLSAEELLRRIALGESPDPDKLQKGTAAALVRNERRFAFDEDGGSNYELE